MSRPTTAAEREATIDLGLAHLALIQAADDMVGLVERRRMPTPEIVAAYEAAKERVLAAESALAAAMGVDA